MINNNNVSKSIAIKYDVNIYITNVKNNDIYKTDGSIVFILFNKSCLLMLLSSSFNNFNASSYEYVSKFFTNDNIIYGYKDHHIDVYNVNGNKLGTFKDSIFFHYYKQYDSFSSEHRLTNN